MSKPAAVLLPCTLLQSKYTSADRLALWGRSAGDLTAGATINRRPELFQVGREGAVLLHFCKPPEGCHACKPQPCCGCVGAAWRRRRRLTLPYKQCHLSAHLHAVFPFTSRAAILDALAHGCGLHSITTWPAHACLEPPLSTPTSRAAILDAPAHGGGLHSLPNSACPHVLATPPCGSHFPLPPQAAILDVPFVDVVSTMSDPSLPLTVVEYEEWGNPGADAVRPQDCKNKTPESAVQCSHAMHAGALA